MDLAAELQKIYDSEINVSISWLWYGGIEVRLGDKVNGFVAEETFADAAGILPWLQQAIAQFYPDSPYAQTLYPDTREKAAQRLYRSPRTAASVLCPHCGALHTPPLGGEGRIQFICSHCGQSVSVEPPKVQ